LENLNMMNYIYSQFGRPRGIVGRLVGMILAYENRERNEWAVSLLDLKPDDRVLEIGFGPGLAIQHIAYVARLAAGVDHSDVMVDQASKRNAAAVREGRVDLRQGTAAVIPFPDATFDKILAVNSYHMWSDVAAGLREVQRVLKPGGLIAIVEQPIQATSEEGVIALADKRASELSAAGFAEVRLEFKPMRPAATIGILGINCQR
jgi:ubiquinone/menaquinone biosynthesis C-methylase UbiE